MVVGIHTRCLDGIAVVVMGVMLLWWWEYTSPDRNTQVMMGRNNSLLRWMLFVAMGILLPVMGKYSGRDGVTLLSLWIILS